MLDLTENKQILAISLAFMLSACGNKGQSPISEASASATLQSPRSNEKTITIAPLPENEETQSLQAACPQIITASTVLIDSDYTFEPEKDKAISLIGPVSRESKEQAEITKSLLQEAWKPEEDKKSIHLFISSGGGTYSVGMGLANAIEHYGRDKFTAICLSEASSSASFSLLAAGKTYGSPTCQVVTHSASWPLPEKNVRTNAPYTKGEIAARKRDEEKISSGLRDYYKSRLYLDDKCANYLTRDRDTALNGEEALKLGFLDALYRPNGKIEIRRGDEIYFSSSPSKSQTVITGEQSPSPQ